MKLSWRFWFEFFADALWRANLLGAKMTIRHDDHIENNKK